MPTYDYECLECGKRFEHFQSISDAPLATCGSCKGRVKRLISAGSGIIFKGSGFYVNDYKNKSSKTSCSSSEGCAAESKNSAVKPESCSGCDCH